MPAITSLLNGQAVNVRFGSISVTCSFASSLHKPRAQLAPPKRPPIMTIRAADCANEGYGTAEAAADAAMPKATSLRVGRRVTSISTIRKLERRPRGRRSLVSGEGDVLVPQRHRTDAFAGCREIGVEHRRSRNTDGRLANAAPEAAARHHDRFHLRHFVDPHRIVVVQIALLDAAVLHGAAAIEQAGQTVDERARDLPFDLRRVDGVAGVGGSDDAS